MNKQKTLAPRPSSQRKMDNILEAARSEFFDSGFAAASIESIAAKASVSKVTIYNHYGDKENLFGEMMKSYVARIRNKFEIANLEQKALHEILTGAALDMLDFLTQEKMIRFERMLGAEVNRDPHIGSFFLENGPRYLLNSLANLLEASIKKGEIQSDDISYSAEMFPSLVMGRMDMMMRYGWKPKLTAAAKDERVKKAVDIWMKIHKVV